MAKLVFDIETSALPLDRFDEAQQEYLFRECEKIAEEAARTTRRCFAREMLAEGPPQVPLARLRTSTKHSKSPDSATMSTSPPR